MVSVFLFLGTLHPSLYFCNAFTFLFIKKRVLRKRLDKNLVLLFVIVGLSAINRYLLYPSSLSGLEFVPDFILIIVVYYLSTSLTLSSLKILVLLFSVEILVGVFEYAANIRSIFGYGAEYLNLEEASSFLYYRIAYGLSGNSSVLGQKALMLILLTCYLKPIVKGRIFGLGLILGAVGLLISFNRTSIIAATLFGVLTYFRMLRGGRARSVDKVILLVSGVVGVCILVIFSDAIINQLFRGRSVDLLSGEVDLSGRTLIWAAYVDFVRDHIFWGNHSIKYFVDHFGHVAHAHNSYLQYCATNGIFIFSIMMFIIVRKVSKENYHFVVPVMVYSLTQYGIFWSFSLLD